MKHDEWCELCEDKLKSTTVKFKGKEIEVCDHCKSLYVEGEANGK